MLYTILMEELSKRFADVPGEDNLSSGLHPLRLPLAGPVDGVILLVGAGVKGAPGDLPALGHLSGD